MVEVFSGLPLDRQTEMDLKASDLAKNLIGAVRTSLGRDWKSARHLAEPELRRLSRSLADIGKLASNGQITLEEAQSLVRIHRNTTAMVLLAVRGLGLLAVENAINSAMDAVRQTVNTATGLRLL